MDPTVVAIVCAVFAVGGLRRMFSRPSRVRRMVDAVAPVAIEQARDGAVVRISGVVRGTGAALVAPVAGTSCVHYASVIVVEQWAQRFDRTLVQDARTCDFELAVGDHTVHVHAADAVVEFVTPRGATAQLVTAPSPALQTFLERRGTAAP